MTCGCTFDPAAAMTQPLCASTSTAPLLPCRAPSYSRACLQGDPRLSPLAIERAARAEHLWTRSFTTTGIAPGTYTFFDVLFAAFTSSGSACIKSVSLTITPAAGGGPSAIPVTIVGIAGVWDFTDSTALWTERVAIPCEAETLDISTTTGRCPCKLDCEGCLYPAGVGGNFMVRYRFPALTVAALDSITFTASGEHTPTEPCCQMPVFLAELPRVTGAAPVLQAAG